MNSSSSAESAASVLTDLTEPERLAPLELWRQPAPAYCPDGLSETEICRRCYTSHTSP